MTTTDNSTRLEALGRERLNAVYQRDEWDARVKQIDAEILALAEPGDTIDVGGEPAYIITAGAHRWDEKKAREVLPDTLVQMLTVTETKLDRKLAQAKLPPDLYRQACVEGKPQIRAAK
jgi:hypothetical protein